MKIRDPAEEEATTSIKTKILTLKKKSRKEFLWKGCCSKHKKRVHKEEEHEAVTQIVVDRAMTISELAEKIQKTPAEIVKFLMFQGIMATVNQLIDIDVIKKICAEYNLEVLDEDLDAYMEEELEKEEKQKALSEVDKKLLKKRAPVVVSWGTLTTVKRPFSTASEHQNTRSWQPKSAELRSQSVHIPFILTTTKKRKLFLLIPPDTKLLRK